MAEEKSNPDSHPGFRGWDWRAPARITGLFLLLHAAFFSPAPFWIDASAYAHAIEHGRKVIQPPGYLLFIEIIRHLSAWFGHPYRVQQVVTLGATVASIFILHRALTTAVGAKRAHGFTAVFAFSWLVLNLGSVGTTHPMDFLFSSWWILLLVARGQGRATPRWHLAFFLVLAAAGSIRLTSAIMAMPLFLLLLIRDWRAPSFWFSAMLSFVILFAVQLFTIEAYGGLAEFRAASAASHAIISPSSLLFGGPWPNVAVNWFRASFWLFLLCPILFLPLFWGWRPGPWLRSNPWPLFGCLAMIAGTASVAFGYLCTHPGYLTPIFPPLLFVAATLSSTEVWMRRLVWTQIALSLVIFFTIRPVVGTGSRWLAAANAYLLQYGAHNHRHAIPQHSLSGWLAITGNTDAIPPERREGALGELDATGQTRPDPPPPP